jgi:hypothetical protein
MPGSFLPGVGIPLANTSTPAGCEVLAIVTKGEIKRPMICRSDGFVVTQPTNIPIAKCFIFFRSRSKTRTIAAETQRRHFTKMTVQLTYRPSGIRVQELDRIAT